METYPVTGQKRCYGADGNPRGCLGTGEDGEHRSGVSWPRPRFAVEGGIVRDRLTGLMWFRTANPFGFPLSWAEAFRVIGQLNRDAAFGRRDWRLPNRRELHSLLDYQQRRPALPEKHPFRDVFAGWYWTSTTAAVAPAHAWYVHLDGGRMFYGGKDQSYLVWPVRGVGNGLLAATGQEACFDAAGRVRPCAGSGQDGELRTGRKWPPLRYEVAATEIVDRLTGLVWWRDADTTYGAVTWQQALDAAAVHCMAHDGAWRLANITELDTLVDAARALPAIEAPFENLREGYWSSTSSAFEPDWVWALYAAKGALGVGQKKDPHFHVLLVRDLRQEL